MAHATFPKLSPTDAALLEAIVDRAIAQYAGIGAEVPRLDITMDVHAVHARIGLRLADLLAAPDFDFMHDIMGIDRHLNRRTGDLEDCFLPRFASPMRPKDKPAAAPRAHQARAVARQDVGAAERGPHRRLRPRRPRTEHRPMKKGKHHVAGAAGKDVDNGIRFEAKLKKRLARRKHEKAGRRAARRKKK